MRMWMVDPALMCDKHLLGEHVECHMLAGSLARRRSIDGFVAKRLLEPASLGSRHRQLALEMAERGFRHDSPLPEAGLDHLTPDARQCTVDVATSEAELAARCPECRERASRSQSPTSRPSPGSRRR